LKRVSLFLWMPGWILLALGAGPGVHAWAKENEFVLVEDLGGDGVVFATAGALGSSTAPRRVTKGEKLPFWTSVQTSPRAAMKVKYPDGSVLVIGRDSKMEIQPKQNGTQFNRLDWGQVRAQIEKAPLAAGVDAAKAPPRFVIRTKTAVMGVRGTDFVAGFEATTQKAQLHTIDGVVDFGTDEQSVMAWKGTPVSAGQEISLGGTEAPAVVAYDTRKYVSGISTAQPEMMALANARKKESVDPGAIDASAMGGDAASAAAAAASRPEPPAPPRLHLLSFRVGALGVFQKPEGKLALVQTAPHVAWDPSFRLLGPLSLKGIVGVSRLKRKSTGESIPVFQVGFAANFSLFSPLEVEAGFTIEEWRVPGYRKSGPCLVGNLVWRTDGTSWFDHVYAGVARFEPPQFEESKALEARAGIGVRF
jgi:hypothetical protein